MNTKSRYLSAILAALFASVVMFSGAASAAHCDHDSEPVEIWEEYDQ